MTLILQTLMQNQPWGMIILVVLFGSVAKTISSIAQEIRKYSCHRHDIELKRELVDRGLPPEEIERIIVARSPDPGEKSVVVNGNYFAPGEPQTAGA